MATRRCFGWVLLPMLAGLACAGSEASIRGQSGRGSTDLAVRRGDLTTRFLLTGELVAEDAEHLVVPNANIWPVQIRWLAEDGIEVSEGDTVVEFDNSQLTANLEEMRAKAIAAANRLDSLKAQAAAEEEAAAFELEQRRAALEKARLEAEVPEGVIADRTLEKRRLDLKKAELALGEAEAKIAATRRSKQAEIEVQRLALDKSESKVARSEARIEALTLRASRDGILILENHRQEERPLQIGDGVYPGSTVGRLPDLETMFVSARLFDVDDGRVAPGMSVTATLDAFPDQTFTGRVRGIDQIADQPSSRSLRRFFRTEIGLDRIDAERMRPGMSVKVLIEQRHEDVLLVPRQCLDWRQGGAQARLEDGTWAPISLGPCDVGACVVESGLAESEALAAATEVRR